MDFDEAIKAHSAWKMKLVAYLIKPDQSIKAEDVILDNQCELGKWIYGEGARHSSLPDYTILKKEHAKFHKCAASIIIDADAGKSVTQEVALGSGSEFSKAAHNVVGAIMNMKKHNLR